MTEKIVTYRLRGVVTDYQRAMAQASASTKGLGRDVNATAINTQRHFDMIGAAAMGMGAAMALGLSKAADKANALNAEMANVGTLIPGQTARVYELRDSVQDLAVGVGKSTTDITGGLYQVISAFGDTADTTKILEVNAQAARAGLATTTDAINLTSAVTKGYGDTTAEAVAKASDLALMTVRLGQTTFPELAASVGRVIPLAASLGVEQEELFAVMATGTGVTGTAAEVSTQLRGVLQSLMAPTADMTGLLAEHGYASGEAALADLGLQGAIELVVGAAEEAGTPLQKYMSQIEGQTLAMALAGPQADVLTDKYGQMGEAAGTTEQALEEMTEGIGRMQFDAEQAAVQQEVAMQKLGEAIAPVKATITGALGDVAEAFTNLSPPMQEAIAKAGMFTSGVGLLGGAALIAGPRLVAMNATLAATGPLGLAASKGISATTGALLGPWGAAAATGATAAYSLQKAFFTARDEASELADEIIATSDTTEEAAARIKAALGDHLDDVFSDESRKRERKNFLFGPIGAFFSLRDQVGQASTALELWGTDVDEASLKTDDLAISAQRGGAAIETLTPEGLLGRLREYRPVADEAAMGLDGMTESFEAAFAPLSAGFDPIRTYTDHEVTP